LRESRPGAGEKRKSDENPHIPTLPKRPPRCKGNCPRVAVP
jgi:hypothetical protein